MQPTQRTDVPAAPSARTAGPGHVSPFRRAAIAALLYAALCGLYIVLSSWLAVETAHSPRQLQLIETAKGLAFVLVTALLFFFVALAWWRKIQRQDELLLQSERRGVAGLFSAALAHDLNNVLMSLIGLVERLRQRDQDDAELRQMREQLERGIDHLTHLSQRMVMSTRELRVDRSEDVDLATAIARIVTLIRKHPQLRGRALEVNVPPALTLAINAGLLEQALMNLVINAAQATGAGGRISLIAVRRNDSLDLEVHDNGPGVPPGIATTIFDPGFTTKKDGTGLGLLSVQAFAASCKATLTVEKSPLGGALFRIRIPCATGTGT